MERSDMRIKEMVTILIVAFFCFCVPASLSSPEEIPHLDHLQDNMKHKAVGGSGIAQLNKIGHAGGGRGGSRPVGVSGGHTNGGGSRSANMHGGSNTIPLYAAGVTAGAAAGATNDHQKNHRNHNGSNRNYNCVECATLAFTILACLLLRM